MRAWNCSPGATNKITALIHGGRRRNTEIYVKWSMVNNDSQILKSNSGQWAYE